MPQRKIYVGIAAVPDQMPANMHHILVGGYSFKNQRATDTPKQTSGGRIQERKRSRGNRRNDNTIWTQLNFDTLGYFLTMLCGTPVTTAVTGATGKFDHVWRFGGQVLPFGAQTTKSVQNAMGVMLAEWWEFTSNRLNTAKFVIDQEAQPRVDFAGSGQWGEVIDTPTALPLEDAGETLGWVQPMEVGQQRVTLNGKTWRDLIHYELDLNNNLSPRHTIEPGADMKRHRIGYAVGNLSMQTEYLGYDPEQTFTVVAATDVFTATAHGYSNGQPVMFRSAGTIPAGLTAGTKYFIRDATANTFKVALTVGGAAVDITTAGTGVHYVAVFGTSALYKNWETNADPESIVLLIQDTDTDISDALDNSIHPEFEIKTPKVLLTEADLPDADTETEVSITSPIGYDDSLATSVTFRLRNAVEAAAYAPS